MTPERWRDVRQVLESALDRDGASRTAFLAKACQGDPPLLEEVNRLLASDREDDFLDPSRVAGLLEELLAAGDDQPRLLTDVDVATLAPGATLVVETAGSQYHITVRHGPQQRVSIRGGRFASETTVRLLRRGRILVGERLAIAAARSECVTGKVLRILMSEGSAQSATTTPTSM